MTSGTVLNCRADKHVKYSFVSVNKFIDAYKQSPAYQRQQLALSAPPDIDPDAPDPLVRHVRQPRASRSASMLHYGLWSLQSCDRPSDVFLTLF